MSKVVVKTFLIFLGFFLFSQALKYGFAHYEWDTQGSIMSLKLVYNYGVAFSMFSFLQEYLKYIQLIIVVMATLYLIKNQDVFKEYYFAIALLYAGGLSNILDRFTYGGVVDFFYWHYGFEFAIFNFADVIIDLAVVIIIYKQIRKSRQEKKLEDLKA